MVRAEFKARGLFNGYGGSFADFANNIPSTANVAALILPRGIAQANGENGNEWGVPAC